LDITWVEIAHWGRSSTGEKMAKKKLKKPKKLKSTKTTMLIKFA